QAPALEQIELPLEPDAMQVDRALETLRSSSRRALVLARRAHRYAGQAAAIDRLLAVNPDAIVVSLREPYDLPLFGRANHLLATYGDDAAAIGGLADVLFGGSAPQGALPVAVAGL
ncbi:MAG TPA: hypothetical protein VMH02_12320, partial [Verrucomicrobiae bacterium]|nr:hypothetical protein [Verrucomicrobiae bacterium]